MTELIFNNFPGRTKSLLYLAATRCLDEWRIPEQDCLIGYHNVTDRKDWPFGENYIEIVAPATAPTAEIATMMEAGMALAGLFESPLIITRSGSRSIVLPDCQEARP